MASVFVTGSSAGIGREAAASLLEMGHGVVVHARNEERAHELARDLPRATTVVIGNLASLAQTKALAEAARGHGPYDAVIHNAGVGSTPRRELTEDGLEEIFQVNVLAPYVLTSLMDRSGRLVYLSSGLHRGGTPDFDEINGPRRHWDGMRAYSGSKLCDVLLAFAVAARWTASLSNAVDPGWVKTRMGGRGAPDTVPQGAETPVWLATSDQPEALVTGRYFRRRGEEAANRLAYDEALQSQLLQVCQDLSGVAFPEE